MIRHKKRSFQRDQIFHKNGSGMRFTTLKDLCVHNG